MCLWGTIVGITNLAKINAKKYFHIKVIDLTIRKTYTILPKSITILTSTPTVIYLCESIGFDIYTRKEYKLYKYNCVSMCVNIRGAVIRE